MLICVKFISIYINYYYTKLNNCKIFLAIYPLIEDGDFLRRLVKKN
jgi:hypothetical protein